MALNPIIPSARSPMVALDQTPTRDWYLYLAQLANDGGISGLTTLFDDMTAAQIADVTAGTGSIDVTTAVQTVIDDGGLIYMPAGKYLVNAGAISATAPFTLFGAGRFQSQFVWSRTTGNVFTIATDSPVGMYSLGFQGPAVPVSGAVISLTGGAGANAFSIFRDLLLANGYDLFSTIAAFAWTVDNCYFANQVNFGCHVENTNNVDNGDSTITSSVFSGGAANSVGIHQSSSGGLRVNNNKILSGLYGYYMALAAGANTSDLLITGNSFENQTGSALAFDTLGGGTFANIKIQNNQIGLTPLPLNMGSATAFMSRISITDNTISLNASGTYGILLANVSGFLVDGNEISGNGGTPIGVAIGASSGNGFIGVNKYTSLPTKVSNGSASTYVQPNLAQQGTATVNCTVTTGSLFYGATYVAFPVIYDSIPTVISCTPGAIPQGISAWPSAVTISTALINCYSTSNTASGAAEYQVMGVW